MRREETCSPGGLGPTEQRKQPLAGLKESKGESSGGGGEPHVPTSTHRSWLVPNLSARRRLWETRGGGPKGLEDKVLSGWAPGAKVVPAHPPLLGPEAMEKTCPPWAPRHLGIRYGELGFLRINSGNLTIVLRNVMSPGKGEVPAKHRSSLIQERGLERWQKATSAG